MSECNVSNLLSCKFKIFNLFRPLKTFGFNSLISLNCKYISVRLIRPLNTGFNNSIRLSDNFIIDNWSKP